MIPEHQVKSYRERERDGEGGGQALLGKQWSEKNSETRGFFPAL